MEFSLLWYCPKEDLDVGWFFSEVSLSHLEFFLSLPFHIVKAYSVPLHVTKPALWEGVLSVTQNWA